MPISSALGSSALLPAGLGFRNVIINGDFRINQRGFTTTQTSGAYGLDRWVQYVSDGTVTYTPQTFTVGNAISGYEPTNYAQIVTTGQTLASARASLWQAIEGVRTFAGQTVTVSFWARATSGTPKVAVTWQQAFGTGGSSPVDTFFGQVTISTSWTRYTITGQVPSISGKTIGTANDALWLGFYFSAGANYNTQTGTLGIQSNTFQIWGIQAEQNYQATPFEQRPIGVELALCQRYYEQSYPSGTVAGTNTSNGMAVISGSTDGSGYLYNLVSMNVQKRAMVTVGASNASYVRFYSQAGSADNVGYNRSGASNLTTTCGVNNGGIGYFILYVQTGAAWVPAYSVFHWVYNCEL